MTRLAEARVDGRPLPDAAIARINTVAAASPLVPRLGTGGREAAWATRATAGQALSTIARDAVELVGGPTGLRLRRCAGADCSLIFADTSRPGRRRWCSMGRCGNRAKVRTFRQRHQQ